VITTEASRAAEESDSLPALAAALAGRYELHLEPAEPWRAPRYIAVATSLDVHPYAIITPDLSDLYDLTGRAAPRELLPRHDSLVIR
jgi:hypothetical protein